jgi:hypothetical protein
MTIQLTDSEQVKDLFKQALLEILQEERELFYDLFAEIIEDMALVKAIKAGEESEVVSRDEVFALHWVPNPVVLFRPLHPFVFQP